MPALLEQGTNEMEKRGFVEMLTRKSGVEMV